MRSKIALALLGACLAVSMGAARAAADAEASEKCLMCHEDQANSMRRSVHSVATDARTPTCVSCHGPSEKHAEDPTAAKPSYLYRGETALSNGEASGVCLACHSKSRQLLLWAGSTHPESGVACSGCHKLHVEKDKVFNKAAQPTVCYTCHKEQRIQANRPWRHPIQEGKMTCSDCHAVHGSAGPKLAKRDTVNTTCYTCHAEKRGPFVQNHQPVAENCSSCHSPHGSNIAAMLNARDPILCNQCHTPHVAGGVGAVGGQPGVFPPPAGSQTVPAVTPLSGGINTVNLWQGRSCLNCHTQIHGSNNPSARGPAPSTLFR
jgi:DmsE family decaheme c-type cytochrome